MEIKIPKAFALGIFNKREGKDRELGVEKPSSAPSACADIFFSLQEKFILVANHRL